eukprot:jgi/Orpsp1_1/1174617/evm.model.c7180000050767.1
MILQVRMPIKVSPWPPVNSQASPRPVRSPSKLERMAPPFSWRKEDFPPVATNVPRMSIVSLRVDKLKRVQLHVHHSVLPLEPVTTLIPIIKQLVIFQQQLHQPLPIFVHQQHLVH